MDNHPAVSDERSVNKPDDYFLCDSFEEGCKGTFRSRLAHRVLVLGGLSLFVAGPSVSRRMVHRFSASHHRENRENWHTKDSIRQTENMMRSNLMSFLLLANVVAAQQGWVMPAELEQPSFVPKDCSVEFRMPRRFAWIALRSDSHCVGDTVC